MRRLIIPAVAALLAVGVVWGAAAIGLGAAIDEQLRRGYYALPAPWTSDAAVALVAVDDDAVAAWGVPPWDWPRWEALVQALERGRPRLVAVVSPGPRLLPPGPPPARGAVARGLATGTLLLPPAVGLAGQPRTGAPDGADVSTVALRDAGRPPGPTLTATLLERLGLASLAEAADPWLTVNYLGRDAAPPRLSARAVAAGAVAPGAFAGRVVLIGLTGATVADPLPTPVGPLTAADVHASAVRAALLGLAWRQPGPPLRAALVVALVVALLALGLRAAGARAALAGAGVAVALVGLDYVLHSQFAVLWGAGTPLVAVAAGLGAGRVLRHRDGRRQADTVAERAVRLAETGGPSATLAEEVRAGGARDDDEAFWRQLVKLNRLYLDVDGALLAEVAPGDWHVRVRAGNGVRPEDVREQRRDVRRPPYRAAAQSGRPVWVDDFMKSDVGLRTLLVPLAGGGELLGFWILHVRQDRDFGAPELTVVDALARQLSAQLAQRRLTGGSAHGQETERVLRAFAQQQRRLAAIVEQMPVGILVASLWGEIRFLNDAFRALLPGDAGKVGATDLAGVLTLVSDLEREQALAAMRGVLVDQPSVTLPRARTTPGARAFDVVLSRVAWRVVGGEGERGPDAAELLTTRFVLTVTPTGGTAAEPRARGRVARPTEPPPLPAEREAVAGSDLNALMRRALVRVRAVLPGDVDLRLSLPERTPVVQGDPALLVEALAGLLNAACRLEPSRHACHVSADLAGRDVRLTFRNPDHAFPPGVDPTLAALEGATGNGALSLTPPAVASGYLEACGAALDVTSPRGAGTSLEIRLARAEAPAADDAPRAAGPAAEAAAQDPPPWTRP